MGNGKNLGMNMTELLHGKTFQKIADKLDWLKKHHNELKAAFNYDVEINYDYFEIAETLTECLCEYPHFLWSEMFGIQIKFML